MQTGHNPEIIMVPDIRHRVIRGLKKKYEKSRKAYPPCSLAAYTISQTHTAF